nr:tetratricopeptide repeat protein [Methanobrevibacter arboriphilus]
MNEGVLSSKGSVLSDLGQKKEALIYFDKSLKIQPDDVITLHNKSSALSELGRFDEALKCVNKALKLNPKMNEAIELKKLILEKISNE